MLLLIVSLIQQDLCEAPCAALCPYQRHSDNAEPASNRGFCRDNMEATSIMAIRDDFDAAEILRGIRQQRLVSRRRRYCRSRLMVHRAELVALRRAGASLADLQLWLRSQRVVAARSTISRYLGQLPELRET